MSTTVEIVMGKLVASAMRSYSTRDSRAALRCALGDAAALCDALGDQIKAENKGRNGKGATTKQGMELAAIAKRCGDEIWEMRKGIHFDDLPDEPSGRVVEVGRASTLSGK